MEETNSFVLFRDSNGARKEINIMQLGADADG